MKFDGVHICEDEVFTHNGITTNYWVESNFSGKLLNEKHVIIIDNIAAGTWEEIKDYIEKNRIVYTGQDRDNLLAQLEEELPAEYWEPYKDMILCADKDYEDLVLIEIKFDDKSYYVLDFYYNLDDIDYDCYEPYMRLDNIKDTEEFSSSFRSYNWY